jgi:hypothetical protein
LSAALACAVLFLTAGAPAADSPPMLKLVFETGAGGCG